MELGPQWVINSLLLRMLRRSTCTVRLLLLWPLMDRNWLGRLLIHIFTVDFVVMNVVVFISVRFISGTLLGTAAVDCLCVLSAVKGVFHKVGVATH